MADAPAPLDTQTVFIRDESGNVLQGQRKDLPEALKSGAEEISPQDVAKIRLQAKYGGVGGQLAAGAISAADAATLGLGTGIAGAVGGEDVKEYIRNVEAANPLSSGLGTALGLIAPAILTGGASLGEEGGGLLARGAEAAALPTRALGAAGEMAGGALTDAMGGGVAARLAGGAARGALEGAVYGANSQMSEDILGDKELTAERLLAAAGQGAFLGGGLGLGARGIQEAAGGAFGRLADYAGASVSGEGKTEATGSIRDAIAKKAAELQFTATGAKTPEIRRATATGLETSDIGRWMLDEMPQFAEGGQAPLTREGILKAANAAAEDAGPKIQAHIDTLDQVGAKPDGQAVIERLRRELIDPLDKKLGMEGVANRMRTIVDKAEVRLTEAPSFRTLYDLRGELDDLAYRDKKVLDSSNAVKELRNARGMIEDEIGKQGEIALGPQWKSGYDAAKRQFRMAATVRDAATAADKRIAGNLGISLSDKIIGAHGLTALALGHPIAAMGALGVAGINHLITKYGDAVGSRLLDKFANVQAVKGMSLDFGGKTAQAVQWLPGRSAHRRR